MSSNLIAGFYPEIIWRYNSALMYVLVCVCVYYTAAVWFSFIGWPDWHVLSWPFGLTSYWYGVALLLLTGNPGEFVYGLEILVLVFFAWTWLHLCTFRSWVLSCMWMYGCSSCTTCKINMLFQYRGMWPNWIAFKCSFVPPNGSLWKCILTMYDGTWPTFLYALNNLKAEY